MAAVTMPRCSRVNAIAADDRVGRRRQAQWRLVVERFGDEVPEGTSVFACVTG